MTRMGFLALALTVTACAGSTSFSGSPKVDDGVAGCRKKCTAWGMELVGMVAVGEYSDGCICQLPAKPGAALGANGVSAVAVAAALQSESSRK